jgi:ABC-type sugar transport system permease subunit
LLAYGFLAPALVFILVFLAYPVVDTLYLSLARYNFAYDPAPTFIGIGNYTALFSDAAFGNALHNTVEYTILFLPTFVVGGFLAALVIESLPRFGQLFRTLVFLPVIVGTSVSGVMFDWILDGQFGLVNHILGAVGLQGLERDWLTDPTTVLPVIVAVSLWKQIGIAMLIFLAGLRTVPQDLYDAARVDGARWLRTMTSITLPNIREYIAMTAVWGIVESIKVFDLPYVMTHGGPGGATDTLYLRLWNDAFQFFNTGQAAAIGYVVAVLIIGLTTVTLWLGRMEAA